MANYTQAPWVEGNKTTYKEFQPPPEAFKKKPTLYDGFQELKNAFTTMIKDVKGEDGKGSFKEIFTGSKDAGKQDNTTQGSTTFFGTKVPELGKNQKALEQLFIKKPGAGNDMDLSFTDSLKIDPKKTRYRSGHNKYNDLIEDKYGFGDFKGKADWVDGP